jgi:hypothetical protein
MNAAHTTSAATSHARARLAVACMLAQLLERLERSTVPVGAEQYRSVVSHLRSELAGLPADAHLSALLDAFPATAELYENLNYGHAGLCRSPLEAATRGELEAQRVIAQARRSMGAEPRDDQA